MNNVETHTGNPKKKRKKVKSLVHETTWSTQCKHGIYSTEFDGWRMT